MKTMSSALEERLKLRQCFGTVVKLGKLSGETGKIETFCLKCSTYSPKVGASDELDDPCCLQCYATGSAGKPVENLLKRVWRKVAR